VRNLLITLLSLVATADAGAQIIRPRFQPGQPAAWVSAGASLEQGFSVVDGTTHARWDFGNATPYVASLEKTVSTGTTLGLRGATALTPLTYTSASTITDADARVSQLFATLHVANGQGVHSVLELSAGATVYSNFRARPTGTTLVPDKPVVDFAFAFGYGFGYSFSPAFSVDVVQDITTSLHQKTGLSASDDSSVRLHGTRLVARFGLGGK
jgi:hypothetical protein